MPDARVACHVSWDEVPDCELGDFRIDTVPERLRTVGDPSASIDATAASLDSLLELARRDAEERGSSAMLDVSADQALAFRVAGHHLDRRVGAEEAVAAIGLQEYPPGWGAPAALRARSLDPLPPDAVQVNAFRGSPYVVPRADARIFTAALVPEDEAGLKALVGTAPAKEVVEEGYGVGEALSLVAAAAREGLAGGPLDRDAFHQAMRERLPDGLLPWCRGCQSHHVRPGFWRALGPLEVTVMPEKATWALAEPPSMPLEPPARSWCGASCASTARRRTRSSRRGRRPRRRTRSSSSRRSRTSSSRPRSRAGRGSCSPRTSTG